jgi:hypothetical protein
MAWGVGVVALLELEQCCETVYSHKLAKCLNRTLRADKDGNRAASDLRKRVVAVSGKLSRRIVGYAMLCYCVCYAFGFGFGCWLDAMPYARGQYSCRRICIVFTPYFLVGTTTTTLANANPQKPAVNFETKP